MKDTFYSTEEKLSAIIFFDKDHPLYGGKPVKYEYVTNSKTLGVQTFVSFVKREFPDAQYINFYSRKTGNYLGRIYLNQ